MKRRAPFEADPDVQRLVKIALGLGWLDMEPDGSLSEMGRAVTAAVENGTAGEFLKRIHEVLGVGKSGSDRPHEVALRGPRPGRPRLDSRAGFNREFCRILPRLHAGRINLSQAARELGISVRSLKRYAARVDRGQMNDLPAA